MNIQALKDKSRLNRALRDFFDNAGYLEVDSPILSECPIPESHIELFRSNRCHIDGSESPMYLLPSPEYWLKLLLASGAPSLYQIGHCFRNGEQLDRWHRLEFTMLEWYTLDADTDHNIAVMQDMLGVCADAVGRPVSPGIRAPLRTITMEEAFHSYAGFSLETDLRNSGVDRFSPSDEGFTAAVFSVQKTLAGRLKERGLPSGGKEESADDLFHRLFLTLVEPELPQDAPLVLKDWPQLVPTLARRISGTPWADRWEMYLKGVEVANCYGEENNRVALETYWRNESRLISDAGSRVEPAADWPERISEGMPACSGAAVGLDRLLALVRGEGDLEGLDLFPIHDMIRR